MALNDATLTSVFGTNAYLGAGNAIPSAISTSANKVLIIVLPEVHAKAVLMPSPYVVGTYTAGDWDTPTDMLALIMACAISYSSLNSKASPTSNLRKFDVTDYGISLNSNNFETGKTFLSQQFNLATYAETTLATNAYDPTKNTAT